MVFMVLLAGATWRVVESATPARIAALALLGVLAVQCAYPNAFLLLGTAAGGAAVLARRRDGKGILVLAGCGALAALSLLPYAGHWKRMGEWAVVVQSDVTLSAVLAKAIAAVGSPHPAVAAAWAVAIAAIRRRLPSIRDRALRRGRDRGRHGRLLFWLVRARYVTYEWNYLPLVALIAASRWGSAASRWRRRRAPPSPRSAPGCARARADRMEGAPRAPDERRPPRRADERGRRARTSWS
jgi:hypothetical protein